MKKDYEKLFSYIDNPEPTAGLLGRVMRGIYAKERQSAFIRSLVFAIGLVASMAAFVPAFQSVQAAMAESGFLAYLGLLFSDTGAILSTGQNFALILLESLPVFSIALFLAILLLLLESAFHLITDASRLFSWRPKTP